MKLLHFLFWKKVESIRIVGFPPVLPGIIEDRTETYDHHEPRRGFSGFVEYCNCELKCVCHWGFMQGTWDGLIMCWRPGDGMAWIRLRLLIELDGKMTARKQSTSTVSWTFLLSRQAEEKPQKPCFWNLWTRKNYVWYQRSTERPFSMIRYLSCSDNSSAGSYWTIKWSQPPF